MLKNKTQQWHVCVNVCLLVSVAFMCAFLTEYMTLWFWMKQNSIHKDSISSSAYYTSRKHKFLHRLSLNSRYGNCLAIALDNVSLPHAENAELPHSFRNVNDMFVVHYSKSTARYWYINQMLAQFNLTARFMKELDREQLGGLIRCMHGNYSISLLHSEISLTAKHLAILYLMVVHKIPNALVLEDDAFVSSNTARFKRSMSDLIDQTPKPYDMLFPGICLDMNCARRPVCKMSRSRCAHGYVVTLRGAMKVLDHLSDEHANLPIDHIMNHANLVIYWANPPIIGQTSSVEHVKT